MHKFLVGLVLLLPLWGKGDRFYMIQDSHGFPCAMERHFPRDRTVYCSADASSVLQLVMGLNKHGYTKPAPPPEPPSEPAEDPKPQVQPL